MNLNLSMAMVITVREDMRAATQGTVRVILVWGKKIVDTFLFSFCSSKSEIIRSLNSSSKVFSTLQELISQLEIVQIVYRNCKNIQSEFVLANFLENASKTMFFFLFTSSFGVWFKTHSEVYYFCYLSYSFKTLRDLSRLLAKYLVLGEGELFAELVLDDEGEAEAQH